MKCSEALAKYIEFLKLDVKGITGERYAGDLRSFFLYCRDCELKYITDETIIEYLHHLKNFNLKHNGIVRKTISFRKFFTYAYKKGWSYFNPELIPNMKRVWVKPRVATEEEYRKLLAVIPTGRFVSYRHIRNKAMIMMLWDTGARNGELVAIDEKDVDLKKMKCLIKTEKSRGRRPLREVFWTNETNEVLKSWIARKHKEEKSRYIKEPHCLFYGTSNKAQGIRITINALDRILREYSQLARIPTLNPHSARHHFGIDLAMKNVNNTLISGLMGHTNLASSQIYTEMNNVQREQAYKKYKRGMSSSV